MIFAMYWKQIVVGLSLLLSIGLIYHKGYTEGKASIQAEWDQQKIVDAQAVAIADNKTATIVTQSNKQTGLANEQFILCLAFIMLPSCSTQPQKPVVAKCPTFPILPDSLTKKPPTQYLVPTTIR